MRQCLPASILLMAGSRCIPDGVQIHTISISGRLSISSEVSKDIQLYLAAKAFVFINTVYTPQSGVLNRMDSHRVNLGYNTCSYYRKTKLLFFHCFYFSHSKRYFPKTILPFFITLSMTISFQFN